MWQVYGKGYIKFVNHRMEKVYVPTAVAGNGRMRMCIRRFKRAHDALEYLGRFTRRMNKLTWAAYRGEPEYAPAEDPA